MKWGVPVLGMMLLGGTMAQENAPYDLSETFGAIEGVVEAAGSAAGSVTSGIAQGVPWTGPMLYCVLAIVALRTMPWSIVERLVGNLHAREEHAREETAKEAEHRRDLERMEAERNLRDRT